MITLMNTNQRYNPFLHIYPTQPFEKKMPSLIVAIMQIICPFLQMSKTSK